MQDSKRRLSSHVKESRNQMNKTVTTITIMNLVVTGACFSADPGSRPGTSGTDAELMTTTGSGAEDSTTVDGDGSAGGDGVGQPCADEQSCSPGTPCMGDEACASGYCVDGVCCDLPCEGSCQTCSANPGTCEAVSPGEDPDLECGPGVCGSAQECVEGRLEWVRGYGAPADDVAADNWDSANGVVVDLSGNVYVIGGFEDSITLGQEFQSHGGQDIFIMSLDPGGNIRWANHYGTAGHDGGTGVAMTPAGSIVAVGLASGDPGFVGEWSEDGSTRGFAVELDAHSGALRQSFVVQGDQSSRARAVAVSAMGDIFVTGGFYGNLLVDEPTPSMGDEDLFLVRLDARFEPVWSWTAGDTGKDFGRGVATHSSGGVAITGFVSNEVSAGLDGSRQDVYLASLQPDSGVVKWEKAYESAIGFQDKGHEVAFLSDGDIMVTGFFSEDLDFGQGALPAPNRGNRDIFVARLASADGAEIWANAYGGSGDDTAFAMAVDDDDHVIIAGQVEGIVNFGGVDLVATGKDIFVAKFTADATHLWSAIYGGEGNEAISEVAVDGSGDVYLAGWFMGDDTYGDTPLNAADHVDALVMKLGR